jgi:hypothetical protein
MRRACQSGNSGKPSYQPPTKEDEMPHEIPEQERGDNYQEDWLRAREEGAMEEREDTE